MWPTKEITVTFLKIESDDWFAYLPNAPELHARARTVEEAFRQLHNRLTDHDRLHAQPGAAPLYNYNFTCTEVDIPF